VVSGKLQAASSKENGHDVFLPHKEHKTQSFTQERLHLKLSRTIAAKDVSSIKVHSGQ
jgi:hypothetical protein